MEWLVWLVRIPYLASLPLSLPCLTLTLLDPLRKRKRRWSVDGWVSGWVGESDSSDGKTFFLCTGITDCTYKPRVGWSETISGWLRKCSLGWGTEMSHSIGLCASKRDSHPHTHLHHTTPHHTSFDFQSSLLNGNIRQRNRLQLALLPKKAMNTLCPFGRRLLRLRGFGRAIGRGGRGGRKALWTGKRR